MNKLVVVNSRGQVRDTLADPGIVYYEMLAAIPSWAVQNSLDNWILATLGPDTTFKGDLQKLCVLLARVRIQAQS